MPLPKAILAARIRADLAEKRIARKELAAWTERSLKTVERWASDAPENLSNRPTRCELLFLAYLTENPLSRYTGDEEDDLLFPLSLYAGTEPLVLRLRAAQNRLREPEVAGESLLALRELEGSS